MDVAWNLSALSRHTTTADSRGTSANHSAARAKVANVPQCRQTFVLQHRIVTLIARNRRFTVDLSGARPRHLKSEFLSMEIEQRFHGAGSSEAFRKTADHVHEALAWLGILLIAQDNEVTTLEHAVLVEFVGKIWADDSYAKRHGLKAVERRVIETLEPLRFSNRRTRQRIETAIKELAQRTDAAERLGPIMRLISQAVQPERGAWKVEHRGVSTTRFSL